MFLNIGSGELMVICLLALLVLGPDKLPVAMREAGKWMGQLKAMSNSFRAEIQSAMDDPLEAAARDYGKDVVSREKVEKAAEESALRSAGASAAVAELERADAGTAEAQSDAGSAHNGHRATDSAPVSDTDTHSDPAAADTGDAKPDDVKAARERPPGPSFGSAAPPAAKRTDLVDNGAAETDAGEQSKAGGGGDDESSGDAGGDGS